MNNILLLALGALLLSSRIGCWAQDADSDFSSVPPPKPPYIARTAQRSAWTIEFTPSENGNVTPSPPSKPGSPSPTPPPPVKRLKQQDWTKFGSILRCVNEWADGTTTEDWVVGSVLLTQDVKAKGIHLYSPKSDPRYHDFGVSDFVMLDWITPKSYDRVVKHGDDVCYLFSAKTLTTTRAEDDSRKTLAQLNAPTTATTVFISVQSGLPVEMDNGDGKYIYHYLPTPTGELKLPDSFLTLLKAYRGH